MAKKLPSVRLLLAFVLAFSMVMPATYIVSLGSENGVEFSSPGMNAESRAMVILENNVFEAWLEGPTHETRIMFSASSDMGQTWSSPARITNSDTVPLNVQMAAGGKSLHLVWSDGITKLVSTGYMSFDMAKGMWSRPVTFNGEHASLAAFGDNVAIATEYNLMLTVYSSVDNGQTFEVSTPMNEMACTRPAVYLDNGKISVACAAGIRDSLTGERSQQGIYYTSTNNPMIWPVQKKLADTSGSVRELQMEKNGGGNKVTWTELTESGTSEYSSFGDSLDVFGQKVLMGSEEFETASTLPSQTLDSRLPPKKWTFICYCVADNNLDSFGWEDINEMEVIGSNADINILVLADGDTSGGPDTHAYYVTQDTINPTASTFADIVSTEIPLTSINSSWTGGELNMGVPQNAIDFVKYVYDNYPSAHYVMDFWNHGGSWSLGMCSDDTSGDDFTMLEVRTIYETLRARTNKTTLFDVAGYDECLMSDVEVDYDEMPYINYICNSEDSIAGDGWEYNIVLGHINNNTNMGGEEAASWVVQSYIEKYGISGGMTTMSIINTSMFASSLCPAINNLAQKGIHEISTYRTQLQGAANAAEDWQGYTHQKDLIHFCQNIVASTIPAGNPIKVAAQNVINVGTPNPVGSKFGDVNWQHDRAIMIHNQNPNENGITIYAASPPYNTVYDTLTWIDTKWDEFYKVLWGADANDPNNEPTVSITTPANGTFVVINTIAPITGTAADSDGSVSRVDVGIHTQHWAAATGTTSWSYNWNTAGWAPGWYKIMARSYDGQDFSAVDVHDVQIIVDPTLPDLSIVPAGVSFNNPAPNEGDTVTITAVTWNNNSNSGAQAAGNATNPVKIGFYDGNPATGGTQIAIVNTVPSILPVNTSGTAGTTWNTAGLAGYHEIYAVADPLFAINELTDANNTGIKSISVAGYAVDLSCVQNESVVQAGASHTYQINVTNTGTKADNITLTIDNPTSWTANFNNNPPTKSRSEPSDTLSKDRPVNGYHTFSEIEAELNATLAAHPGICQLYSIGTTWESRQLWVMKISDNPTVNESEPEVYINGGIHAREWIGEEVVLYYMNWLVDNYGTDPQATWLVDNRQIYLSPCVNPDGFVYSQTTGDWRKNRRNNGDGTYGVDLNRNWNGSCNGDPNGAWGVGESHTTSSETYCGPSAFSEPETQAMRNFILAHNFQITITYHSYGEELYWPWGYSTSVQAPHNALLSAVGTALAAESGYTPMQSSFLYTTTGDTDDWIYGYNWYNLSKIVSAHTIELAGSFQPPQSEITPICLQNLGSNQLAAEVADNIYLNSPTITHTPLPDTTNTAGPYVVSVDITTPIGLQAGSTRLYWQTSGAWTPVTMTNTGGNTWAGNIPGQPDGTWVRYYVETMDTNLHKSSAPKYAPYAYHDFFVGNDVVEYTVSLNSLASRIVNFTVQAPSGALPNEYAIIDVIGTSDNDITKTDSVSTRTTVMPGILLVNDGNSGIAAYQLALDNNGYLYDIGTPSSDLSDYRIVIWATYGSAPLDATERTKIENFINAGGSLYINGEDIGYSANSLGWLPWYYANLHATYTADNSASAAVNGITGDPITNGMSNYDISGNYSEVIGLYDAYASRIFNYTSGTYSGSPGALKADTGTYKLVYIGFEYYEGTTDSQANKDLLMFRILEWLNPDKPPVVTVTNPTGTNVIGSGNINIQWSATDDNALPANPIDLYYSINGGSSWTPIVTGIANTGSYAWSTVPLSDGVNYLARVSARDSAGQTDQDESDNPFSVDNTANDRWYMQVQSGVAGFKDLDMKPVELVDNTIFSNITGAGDFMIGSQRYISPAMTQDVNVQGTWDFSAWGRVTNSTATGRLFAKVYSYNGGTSLLFQTGTDDELVGSFTSFHEFTWSFAAPSAAVLSGQRIVVEIWLNATAGVGNTVITCNATSDIPVSGTLSGTYTRTRVQDDLTENVTEVLGANTELVNQTFDGTYPPTGWGENDATGNWNQVTSANAGGVSPEACFNWISQTSTWRLYCGPLNTAGYTALTLRWRNYFNDYADGVTVRVQTSQDGTTWHNSSWYINSGGGDVGPALNTTVLTTDVGSSTFYVAFVVQGNAFQLDYWYIDNVTLNGSMSTSYLEHKWPITVPAGKAPYNFRIDAYRTTSADNDNFTFAYSTDNSTFTNMVTVSATSDTDTYLTYTLPTTLSGTVYIRVSDTDRTTGRNNLDSIRIDHMYIEATEPSPKFEMAYDFGTHQSYVEPKLLPGQPTFNIPVLLSPGWNFISYPLLANGAPQTVLNDAAGDNLTKWNIIRWYDVNDASDHWKSYTTFTPASLCDLATINNTMGLWIYITQVGDGYLTVQASQPASTNINLKAGWNLIGYPSLTPRLASTTLPPSADIVGIFNGTDPYKTTDMAPTAVTMQAGKAYWVHCTSDAIWTVPW